MSPEELVNRLATEEKAARRVTVEQLRALLPESLPAVLDGFGSPNPHVRDACAAVVDHAVQDGQTEAALRRATRDPDARVRFSALHSLSCVHCKPDQCVAADVVELLVDALLHDPSVRLRRKVAGTLMWGQAGRGHVVRGAFTLILATEGDKVLRERAATFLASCELPREGRRYRDWLPEWKARIAELSA